MLFCSFLVCYIPSLLVEELGDLVWTVVEDAWRREAWAWRNVSSW